VLILASIAFLILMSLSAYILPVSNRAFKDLQFEIRNRFVGLSLIPLACLLPREFKRRGQLSGQDWSPMPLDVREAVARATR
jgi:hypothetical protein